MDPLEIKPYCLLPLNQGQKEECPVCLYPFNEPHPELGLIVAHRCRGGERAGEFVHPHHAECIAECLAKGSYNCPVCRDPVNIGFLKERIKAIWIKEHVNLDKISKLMRRYILFIAVLEVIYGGCIILPALTKSIVSGDSTKSMRILEFAHWFLIKNVCFCIGGNLLVDWIRRPGNLHSIKTAVTSVSLSVWGWIRGANHNG